MRQKLDAKSTKGIFVGYATCEKGYRVYDLVTKKLILSRDVVFDENAAWDWKAMLENLVFVSSHEEQFKVPEATSPKAPIEGHDHIQSPRVISPYTPTSGISSSMRNSQAFDHTPLKWRNLDDVLAQCNLCIMEPKKFDEATKR